jgi:hypothetical protein
VFLMNGFNVFDCVFECFALIKVRIAYWIVVQHPCWNFWREIIGVS